jgi:transcriptional regulator
VYTPPAFREADRDALLALMREYPFAALVTREGASACASHLPFLVDAHAGPWGTLRGHMARANPQWRHLEEQEEVLVLFQGPHAYVSPTWYRQPRSVPTWNYVAVHAYGTPRLVEGEPLLALLDDMVREFEGEEGWKLGPADDWLRSLARGIVGFEIRLTRVEGKRKLSQNRPEEDREGAADGLARRGGDDRAAIARMMREVPAP